MANPLSNAGNGHVDASKKKKPKKKKNKNDSTQVNETHHSKSNDSDITTNSSESTVSTSNVHHLQSTDSKIDDGSFSDHEVTKKSNRSSNRLNIVSVILVGIISLLFGLITPPFLQKLEKQQRKYSTQRRAQELLEAQKDEYGWMDCTPDALQDYWPDEPLFGYHIVCFHNNSRSSDKSNDYSFTFYSNGMRSNEKNISVPLVSSWEEIRPILIEHLNLTSAAVELHQPWAIFSTDGDFIVNEFESNSDVNTDDGANVFETLFHYKIGIIYQGGQFIWPGIRIGYQRSIPLYETEDYIEKEEPTSIVTLETLSVKPLVLSVKGFLSEMECDHIQTNAMPSMQYSDVVLMDKDAGRPASDFRTSQTTFLKADNDDVLLTIEYRTASLVRVPRYHQEPVQVLRYAMNEKYDSHHDYFDPKYYQNDKNTLNLIEHGRRNRMTTVFWYLSDVEAGGETVFPRFNNRREKSMKDCSGGLLVKPEKGKSLIFYSLTPDGKMDDSSLHGACPVKNGTKWAANKWVWNAPMRYVS